jgi:hypothetical protein
MHALTIDPRTGLPRGEKPPASTAAVISLVCGILLCLPLAGVPAIIAGVSGRRRAREQPHLVGGANMALFGIGLGVLNLLFTALLGLYVIVSAFS